MNIHKKLRFCIIWLKIALVVFPKFKLDYVAFFNLVNIRVGRHSKKRFPTYKTQIGTELVKIRRKFRFIKVKVSIVCVVFSGGYILEASFLLFLTPVEQTTHGKSLSTLTKLKTEQ